MPDFLSSSALLLIIEFMVAGVLILEARRFFGLHGLYVYGAVGVVAANLAVLKMAYFPFYENPMALGTVIFSSLFLCSDIINEFYGKAAALKSVTLGFFAYFSLTLFMFITLAYTGPDQQPAQNALRLLFLPAPAIFISSLVAYFLGQYVDVVLYSFIHKKTGGKWLWLRSAGSTFIAMLIDNAVFSYLAWHFLSSKPIPLVDIFWTYTWGVTILRFFISFGNIGFMYLAEYLTKDKPNNVRSLF